MQNTELKKNPEQRFRYPGILTKQTEFIGPLKS
jgi:hypothetical protein